MKVDNCKGCKVPEREYDPESEDYFDCSMCPCYSCEYLHNCEGQCYQESEAITVC